ncbi:hypothetical protein RI844_11680 [Thalassotalea fonticola]|uniref:DUF3426 domain-containing protein n=1 Tax=Thalassotalea fonticola TaxID=3065649 RepID=A0ABZ0GJH8_9GAMM|nr:hypothetical protein RI844_11680 [Colwelliaceae bacterium S1-1]
MLTREERSRRIKRNAAIKKVALAACGVLLLFWVMLSLSIQRDDSVVLNESWHECIPNQCSYKITINNTSRISKTAYVRIKAYFQKSHPDGGDTFHIVNTERMEVYLEQSEQRVLEGVIKVPLEAHFLKFSVGDVNSD